LLTFGIALIGFAVGLTFIDAPLFVDWPFENVFPLLRELPFALAAPFENVFPLIICAMIVPFV
jgi:hypothetical protein